MTSTYIDILEVHLITGGDGKQLTMHTVVSGNETNYRKTDLATHTHTHTHTQMYKRTEVETES